MIWHRLLSVAGLAGMVSAMVPVNKCFQEIVRNKHGREDCECFLSKTTTLPVSTPTVTVTARPVTVICKETRTANVSTTETTGILDTTTTVTSIIRTTPIQEAVTSETLFTTGTLTDYVATTLVTVHAPVRGSNAFTKRDGPATRREIIPPYASDCLNSAQYSFECRCAGATVGVTTVTPPPANTTVYATTTPTVTDRVYTTRTNTATVIDASSTRVSTELDGRVSFVSTKTFWVTIDTTATTDIATVTGGTLTETTTILHTFRGPA